MSEIETAIENLIQFHIDENDFITRVDAEQYFEEGIASVLDDANFITGMEAEQYTDQCVSDCEDSISELIVRIEALEEKLSPAMVNIEELQSSIDSLERIVALVTGVSPTSQALEEKAAPAAEEQEPRAVNQIDWILGERAGSISIFAGYPTIDMLEQFVRSNLGTEEESKP